METNYVPAGKPRLLWIDNLRALMIIFVVLMHVAVTYSGMGGWYFVQNENTDIGSKLVFAFYQMFTQAYFMSLLFMIAGYFTLKSLGRKSTGKFISGRLFRLGVPLLIYMIIIHPLCVKMIYPELSLIDYYIKYGFAKLEFFSWTGPLWFVEALLIFTFIYLAFYKFFQKVKIAFFQKVNTKNIIILILLITIVAFLARLKFPLGTDVTNLQLGFFSGYIFMFALGILAFRNNLFDQIDYKTGKKWFYISLGIGVPTWLLFIFFGGPYEGDFSFDGGMNWAALFYALWESFICVTFSIGLIGIFKEKYNNQSRFQHFLSDNAFGVFVFHAPVLIGISILLRNVYMYPLVSFVLVGILAISVSFFVSWLIRRVKIFRRLFS